MYTQTDKFTQWQRWKTRIYMIERERDIQIQFYWDKQERYAISTYI